MTLCIAAALVTCIVCAVRGINIVLWFGLCIWVVCAAGAGAVVGAVFGQAATGVIVATGGALGCIFFVSPLFSSEHRNSQGATANAGARLKLETHLRGTASLTSQRAANSLSGT
jgi:hypothetical protein